MFSSKISVDSVNLVVVNITTDYFIEWINSICTQAKKTGLSLTYIETQSTPKLSDINKDIYKRIWSRFKKAHFIQIKDNPDFDISEIMFVVCRYSGSEHYIKQDEKREIDVFVSLHGLMNYAASNRKGKLLIAQELIRSFGDRVILNRLDIAFDYRPEQTNRTMQFDRFSIKRGNKQFTHNPNNHNFESTRYIESRDCLRTSEKLNPYTGELYISKSRPQRPFYSYYYDKSIKSGYPYSIFRHELVFGRSKLKALGINSPVRVTEEACKNLARYVDKCKYVNYYESFNWLPPLKELSRFLLWFFDYLNDRRDMTPKQKRAYESAEQTFLDAQRVLRVAKDPTMRRAGGGLNVSKIADSVNVGREFARKVLERKSHLDN